MVDKRKGIKITRFAYVLKKSDFKKQFIEDLKEKLTFRQQIGCILVISGLFIGMIQP